VSRSYQGAEAVAALPGLYGHRVALRHRLGSGADAGMLTDAVGELAPDGPDAVRVQTRGGPVTVPLDAVAAVRAVPPAPAARPSWSAVARLEGICADGWPAPVDAPLGRWRLRAAGGFTGRANSALVLGDPGLPVPDALARVAEFAHRYRLPPRVQVPEGSPWHTEVAALGWAPETTHQAGWRVEVLVGSLEAPGDAPAPAGLTVTLEGRERWRVVAEEDARGGRADQRFEIAREHVLTAPGLPHLAFAVARRGAELVGAVRLAVLDGHLYVTRLAVDPDHRRLGVATALMDAAGRWGREHGASWSVLQVADTNIAALDLYRRRGHTRHHRYVYLRPPVSD
jgi:ribosomal protein S18 acetylase RimI-like enzyme